MSSVQEVLASSSQMVPYLREFHINNHIATRPQGLAKPHNVRFQTMSKPVHDTSNKEIVEAKENNDDTSNSLAAPAASCQSNIEDRTPVPAPTPAPAPPPPSPTPHSAAEIINKLKIIYDKYFTCPVSSKALKNPVINSICLSRYSSESVKGMDECPTCKAGDGKVTPMTCLRRDDQYQGLGEELLNLISVELSEDSDGATSTAAAKIVASESEVPKTTDLNTDENNGQKTASTEDEQTKPLGGLKRKNDAILTPFEKFLKKKKGVGTGTGTDTSHSPANENTSELPPLTNKQNGSEAEENIKRIGNTTAAETIVAPVATSSGSASKPKNSGQNDIQPGHGGLITTPGSNDVLNGRGGRINSHKGNIQFRQLVHQFKHTYLQSKKLDKVKIANQIVLEVRSLKPSGRFLREDSASGKWVEIGDDKARKKAGQAMREKSDETRKEMKKSSTGPSTAQAKGGNGSGSTSTGADLATLASVALCQLASSGNSATKTDANGGQNTIDASTVKMEASV